MIALLKLLLINTLEILVAALTGGLVIAFADYLMKHRMTYDLPLWKDYLGRAMYYAAILWFHIYAGAIFVLFLIAEVVMKFNNFSFPVIVFICIILFALMANAIWYEAYSYAGINKSEKRLKNTFSLISAAVLFAFYVRWLSRRQWTQISLEEEEETE